MFKRIMIILAVAMFVAATDISAQGMLMNPVETFNKCNVKAAVFPTVLPGKNGSDSMKTKILSPERLKQYPHKLHGIIPPV